MKKNRNLIMMSLFFAFGLVIALFGKAGAEDIDALRTAVKSNAMVVFDTSGSMAWPVYDRDIDYRAYWYWATGVTPASASPLGYDDDNANTHKVITTWEKNKIYLVSAYLGHGEITGSQGEKYSVFGDPMFMYYREGFIEYGILDTGWTYTDLDDPVSGVTIETITDSDGKKWVVYPSAFSTTSGVTVPVNDYPALPVLYVDNARSGVTFANHQSVLLSDQRVDPRTQVTKDYGFLGYLKAPGIYFSGLFRDGAQAHSSETALTDLPADAMTLFGQERVYGFVTGNYLSFMKIVEDLTNNAEESCTADQMAWEKLCYKPDALVWTTVRIGRIQNDDYGRDYPSNRDEHNGTIDISSLTDAEKLKIHFSRLDVENRTIPGANCSNTRSNNDGVYLEDTSGNRLMMVSAPDSRIHETDTGLLHGANGRGWTGEYNVEGLTSLLVKFKVALSGGDNCSGSDKGYRIDKIQYSHLLDASTQITVTGAEAFTCCNGTDSVGYKIRSRLETAVEALKIAMDATSDKISWGLLTFGGSDGGTLQNQLGSSISDIKTSLDDLVADGRTPMGEAMQDAYDAAYTYLSNNTTSGGCATNFMVVMTDGFPSLDNKWNRISAQTAPNFLSTGNHDSDTWAGDPTQGNYGNTANYSDDVARWMYVGSDWGDDTEDADHLFTTHTIGFALESPLLEDVAGDGGGINITAMDRNEMINAFYSLGLLMSESVSYVAPVVTVDEANRTQSGDNLYIAFFKPVSEALWPGNLKKYGLTYTTRTDCNRTIPESVLSDSNGVPAGDCTGLFKDTSVSYWSDVVDGGVVTSGGVGAILKDAMPGAHAVNVPATGPYYNFRNIYTYKGGPSMVRFWRDGDSGTTDTITPTDLGVNEYQDPELERDKLINFIYGYTYEAEIDGTSDSYDEDAEGDPLAKRPWILGDNIHSQPKVIDYLDANNNVEYRFIAMGANDGMLHVFTDEDMVLTPGGPLLGITPGTYPGGSEIFAFIPGDLLPKLLDLQDTSYHSYFVDGFVSLHRKRTRDSTGYYPKTLVFGERRGGRSYWALDITEPDPSKWTVKWHLEGGVFSDELGYSWSKPSFASLRTGSGTTSFTDVVIFGGGYDTEEDNYPEPWSDENDDGKYDSAAGETYEDANNNGQYDYYNPDKNEMGRGIFVVDLDTGALRFAATYGALDSTSGVSQRYSAMKWSFPADPSVIEMSGRLLAYFSDVYGQVWKVTYDYNRTPQKWVVKRIFESNPGSDQAKAVDALTLTPSLNSADQGRKTFYSPDVSFGNDWTSDPVLYLGTGDRSHPRYVPNYHDRFYAFSDTDILADETQLLNLTCDELDVGADTNQDNTVDSTNDTAAANSLLDILYGDRTIYGAGNARGWYKVMGLQGNCTQEPFDHEGEKVLSRPTVFAGVVYFTTFQPVFIDPCDPSGNAMIYALGFSEGIAAMDLNIANDSGLANITDTFRTIGNSSIASGVRILIRQGRATGLVSAAGSITGAGEAEGAETGNSTNILGQKGGISRILWQAY